MTPGEQMHALGQRAVTPILPQHHPATACARRWPALARRIPLALTEVSVGERRCSTGRCPRMGTCATRTWPDASGARRDRFSAFEPSPGQLQHARCARGCLARRAAPAPAYAARPPRLDPLPHLLLRGALGVLPDAAPAGRAAGRRIRRVRRLDAGARAPDLRRARAAGRDRG
jgi:hypothetical protein